MTSAAHLAGTEGDYQSALFIYNKWSIEQKLDYVKIIDYNVLLSYPDNTKPNKSVSIVFFISYCTYLLFIAFNLWTKKIKLSNQLILLNRY